MINLYGPTVIANTISKKEMRAKEQKRGEDNFGFEQETDFQGNKDDKEDDATSDWIRQRWITAKENVTSLQSFAMASNSTSRKNSVASVVSSNFKVDLEDQKEEELSGIFTAAVKARRESTQWSLVNRG